MLLPIEPWPVGGMTLKNRTLAPVVKGPVVLGGTLLFHSETVFCIWKISVLPSIHRTQFPRTRAR